MPAVVNLRIATLADANAIAGVHATAWRESYVEIIPVAILEALSVADRADLWRKILTQKTWNQTYVADREGRIVGFAGGGPCRDQELGTEMEVYAIYLIEDAKRHGIGGRLLRAVIGEFLTHGSNSASLWVLKENHAARRFYERFGARLVTEKTVHRSGYDLIEVGYVWKDLKNHFGV